MRLILGNRGSGKTTTAIKEANLLTSYGVKVAFIVPYKDHEQNLRAKGLKQIIPVYTVAEAQEDEAVINKNVLFFDDLSGILHSLFKHKDFRAFCATADLEKCEILGSKGE